MKRVPILLALLMLCSHLWPAGLSFDAADRSFRFDSTHLSYNSATGYMKARFGPVEAGSLSGNWHVFSLFDSYAYAWKEHYVHTSGTLRGLALDFPEASFFLIHHPFLALGASTRLLGMELAVARIWRGEADDELFEVHGERSGFESFVMKLGYSDEHFMVDPESGYGYRHARLRRPVVEGTGYDIHQGRRSRRAGIRQTAAGGVQSVPGQRQALLRLLAGEVRNPRETGNLQGGQGIR